ncbi:MAG: tRNA (adenosine(37)-N6)-dimethylallyltransferase MiaA [SAR202 cluster bacterium Io17-Chloro-G3]|nr:MAG: tRNA (adenosine(37)-N6)-dimethylallyltransferase MiaA [SAR202 cluster bacterium Io17-Chloro-G3]
MNIRPSLLCIVGPTAVGKTALSLALSSNFQVEIISVDSRQVYRGMDVGTAKPTLSQQIQVPHHLIDVVDPWENFDLTSYLTRARKAINEVHLRGCLPILVGGTGQYLAALLEAWDIPQVPPDPTFRRNLEEFAANSGADVLHLRLMNTDPVSAKTIDYRNVRRVIRALEIYHQTGIPASELRRRGTAPFNARIIGLTLPRQELYCQIDRRVDRMIANGWVGEVESLLAGDTLPTSSAMASVGYGELAAYLQATISLDEATRNTKIATHRFARQQYGWFRLSDPRIRWFHAGPKVSIDVCLMVESFLNESLKA